ncbi:MAG: ABC transporter ATP-binding protein [Sphaerochaetaceae bacterium]|jgi:oligopeptide transport system ATP-binding protein|nr:ABC transporter ATP-binding protein [Sphaerochaetaceae bacterium]MDD3941980.1 ABC transporter ATP-binding protein [Sphaerochaetaceae bacterium]MDX9939636.1 ABC transporter ATP-binding protein [Sphaerochaetaceae bacterium]
MANILEVRDLKTRFYTREGVVKAVNGISYTVDEGEILAIVGESGCGKSVGVLSLMQLIQQPPGKIESGEALFQGIDLLKLSDEEIRKVRGKDVSMIFQDPMTSLNPVLTVKRQMIEGMLKHTDMTKQQAYERAVDLLKLVGIPNAEKRIEGFAFQLSGGMRQRVMIAMALTCNPKLLIADEPTTALDVTIQAQIMKLIKEIQQQFKMAVIWITHDLGVVANFAQNVQVMYSGYIVEKCSVKELFAHGMHPYTLGLLNSLPKIQNRQHKKLETIKGAPPNLLTLTEACPFAPRCPKATERCIRENPPLDEITSGHWVACWNIGEGGTHAE